ncbi:MAG: GNAT family N-acetyltransferase, partial [Phototrophicaceae bacterium]
AVQGGASVSFIIPFGMAEASAYWDKVSLAVGEGSLNMLGVVENEQVIACVQLSPAWQPNAPHRAEVQKLLVLSSHRRHGLATLLMNEVEVLAQSLGRWLLFLDTEAESVAPLLYTKLGYTRLGEMPHHAMNHAGQYAPTLFFYKILPTAP